MFGIRQHFDVDSDKTRLSIRFDEARVKEQRWLANTKTCLKNLSDYQEELKSKKISIETIGDNIRIIAFRDQVHQRAIASLVPNSAFTELNLTVETVIVHKLDADVLRFIGRCSTLQNVIIFTCYPNLSDEDLHLISENFSTIKRIEFTSLHEDSMSCPENDCRGYRFDTFLHELSKLSNLKNLTIESNAIGVNSLTFLPANLETLMLDFPNLEFDRVHEIIKRCKRLSLLVLGHAQYSRD